MELRPLSRYVRELRGALPVEIFAPARTRLAWLPAHLLLIALLTWAVAAGHVPRPLLPVASLVMGVSFAGLTFLAHETLHGAIVRGLRARRIVGWIGLLPFL